MLIVHVNVVSTAGQVVLRFRPVRIALPARL